MGRESAGKLSLSLHYPAVLLPLTQYFILSVWPKTNSSYLWKALNKQTALSVACMTARIDHSAPFLRPTVSFWVMWENRHWPIHGGQAQTSASPHHPLVCIIPDDKGNDNATRLFTPIIYSDRFSLAITIPCDLISVWLIFTARCWP